MFSIFEGFWPQNIPLLFLVFIKPYYLLTAKFTPEIDHWGYSMKSWGHFIKWPFIEDIKYFNTTIEE